ncbi:hypothetical protein [Mycobacterium sp. EPa45]|uniref:hypothetical protein n=1 Tax=Mycobacterium sp. EPa45 TaxID=1545728 RepID=UPI0006422592|nr:hypothetical protein [Mycobacterium sp. EPa45]AKK30727.1 hypothetical protein AB431_20790 [Mycobacterium sp. EPa45]
MSTDDQPEIIDAEVVELMEIQNPPAVIEAETDDSMSTHGAETPIEGRDWSTYSKPERRCTARSSRTGNLCKNAAILGSHVCRYHGGAAKQVKQAARTRLENAAELMAKQLLGMALTADTESVKLAAIRDALDRAGLKAPSEIVVSPGEPKAFETVFDSIGGAPGESLEANVGYGQNDSPAPAYTQVDDAPQAEAEEDAPESSDPEPPLPSRPRGAARDRPRQPPVRHITGEAAIYLANAANREIGALPPLRELESPHRRYRRP